SSDDDGLSVSTVDEDELRQRDTPASEESPTTRWRRGAGNQRVPEKASTPCARPVSVPGKRLFRRSFSPGSAHAKQLAALDAPAEQQVPPQPARRRLFGRRREKSVSEIPDMKRNKSVPLPQPLHRVRGSQADTHLSMDPDFFPPTSPLAVEGVAPLQGVVRYGSYLRLWGFSQYEHKGGYVGYLRRTRRRRNAVGKGELFILPPVPDIPSMIYHEACFKVVDPHAEKADGAPLCFGDEMSLVDDRGMVWNNKDGRLHGRLGPSLFGNGGYMHLTLHKKPQRKGSIQTAVPKGTDIGADGLKGAENGISSTEEDIMVKWGDNCVLVAKKVRPNRQGVVRAPVTHFRRQLRNVGGFLRSDGKGKPISFEIHHAPPRITTVAVYAIGVGGQVLDTHTHYKVPWNQEVEVEMPPPVSESNGSSLGGAMTIAKIKSAGSFHSVASNDDEANPPSVRISLSNGGELLLRGPELKDCLERARWYDISPSDINMCLQVTSRCITKGGSPKSDSHSNGTIVVAGALLIGSMGLKYAALSCSLHLVLVYAVELLVSIAVILCVVKSPKLSALFGAIEGGSSSHDNGREQFALKVIKCEAGSASEHGDDEDTGASKLPPMPETFLMAEFGDHDKAMARWKDTCAWRKEMGSDEALATPHPKFDICKAFYPTCFHGRDKTGSVVYYEKLGKIDVAALSERFKQSQRHLPYKFYFIFILFLLTLRITVVCLLFRGVTTDFLLWHYMYQMEYLWTVINPSIEDKCTIVLDMAGVKFSDIKGEVLAFIKAAIKMLSTHYPARSDCIFIMNVPTWFGVVFRIIKPVLPEVTKQKIRPYDANSTSNALIEWIGADKVPREYGGESPHPMGQYPWEVDMREQVRQVLSEASQKMIPVDANDEQQLQKQKQQQPEQSASAISVQ
ncbi:unnamed protein product, partial [Chrysoparadoxa australica]